MVRGGCILFFGYRTSSGSSCMNKQVKGPSNHQMIEDLDNDKAVFTEEFVCELIYLLSLLFQVGNVTFTIDHVLAF